MMKVCKSRDTPIPVYSRGTHASRGDSSLFLFLKS